MATPREIVECVSEHMGVPLGTVIIHDRNLAVAGLRSQGVRGRGISVSDASDAANLIIAVAGSRSVKDSVETNHLYADLLEDSDKLISDFLPFGKVKDTSFKHAVEYLLEAIPNNRVHFKHPLQGYVEVTISGPKPIATIEVLYKEKLEKFQYGSIFKRYDDGMELHDLQYFSKFTQLTLGFVGEKLLQQ